MLSRVIISATCRKCLQLFHRLLICKKHRDPRSVLKRKNLKEEAQRSCLEVRLFFLWRFKCFSFIVAGKWVLLAFPVPPCAGRFRCEVFFRPTSHLDSDSDRYPTFGMFSRSNGPQAEVL